MKKFLLSTSVLVVFVLYAIHLHSPSEEGNRPIAVNTPGPSSAPPESSSAPSVGSATPPPSATTQAKYKDGTYVGDVADAFYGNIQVQVTIAGGQITDVQFLQYPNDRSTSIEINTQAMPLLKQEAIQAQSANVSGVSGASATSGAFIQSLQSALNKAV